MILNNDKYGRTVSVVTANGEDTYTVSNSGDGSSFTIAFPAGTPVEEVYFSIEGQSPSGWVPPAIPLNVQYSPSDYGKLLIGNFSQNNLNRSLTSAQMLSMINSLLPFYFLLQNGAFSQFLAAIDSVTVDGVIITSAMIAGFKAAINNYLAGN